MKTTFEDIGKHLIFKRGASTHGYYTWADTIGISIQFVGQPAWFKVGKIVRNLRNNSLVVFYTNARLETAMLAVQPNTEIVNWDIVLDAKNCDPISDWDRAMSIL